MSEDKEEKEYITLWDLKIPVDKGFKQKIWNLMKEHVTELLQDSEEVRAAIRNGIINHRKFYLDLFRPVVKDIIEDLEMRAKVYWNDDD